MNAKNLSAALLPVVFAFASLGTVACTAESETVGAAIAQDEGVAPVAPVEALSGAAASTSPVAPAPDGARAATAASTLRLAVTDPKTSAVVNYDVVEFDFGVDGAVSSTTASGTLSATKATLRPLEVVVRKNPTSTLLARNLLAAEPIASVVLQRADAYGKFVDFAKFERLAVTRMETDASDDTTEKYQLVAGILTASDDKGSSVTVDVTKNVTTWAGTTSCVQTNPGKLGPYTQAGLLAALPKGSTQVDSVSVVLHNEAVIGSASFSTSKAVFDGMEIERSLESSGLCAMFYAGKGYRMNDVRVGIAGPVQPSGAPIEATTWDACVATVSSVGFSGTAGEATRERMKLDAAGLLRTDRDFDPITGVLTKTAAAPTGWSFAKNIAITSCSDAL